MKTGGKTLKICMVSPNYPPNTVKCGVGDYTRELCQAISMLGHEIIVIASNGYSWEETDNNISIKVIPFTNRWGIKALIRLFIFLKAERFDLINLQYSPPLYGFWFKLFIPVLRLAAPVIITFHTVHGGPIYNKLIAMLLILFSSKIISSNEEVDYIIKRYFFIFRNKVASIPIGSNIPIISMDSEEARVKVQRRLNLERDYIILLHFGLFYPDKGVETIIAALGDLKKEYTHFHMVMLGGICQGKEVYYESLKMLASRLGLDSFITWIGYKDKEEVSLYLSATDIYLIPYDRGVSSRRGSLMAGLAHSLPIISTVPSVPSRYFKNNENLLLISPRNSSELKNAVLYLIQDVKKRKALGEKAGRLYREFSWDKIAIKSVAFFK